MPLILGIESSTSVCSVALADNGEIIASLDLYQAKSHADNLGQMVKDLLNFCKYNAEDLDAVAVSAGPGSYTGLRIGVSLAKGICFSSKAKLIGINSLEALAFQLINRFNENYLLVPMFDARRMEVYTLVANNIGDVMDGTQALILDKENFGGTFSSFTKVLFGDGAQKAKQVFTERGDVTFLDGILPSAKSVIALAYLKYEQGKFENLAYFEPFYLKEYQATKAKQIF